MATNTGIEVTALRPAASAGDFYVRPEAQNSGIAQGLERLAGSMSKKKELEDKARAEYLSLSDSLDATNVDALHNMQMYAHESPAVQARILELRGQKLGNKFGTDAKAAWNEWKTTAPADGTGIEEFFSKQKESLAQSLNGNKFMVAGAMGRMREVESSLRAQHSSYLDSRIRGDAVVLMDENLGSIMLSVQEGSLSRESGLIEVQSIIDDTVNTGVVSRPEAAKNTFDSFIAAYKQTNNWFARELAEKSIYATGPNGKKVTNIKAIAALEAADDYIADEQAREEREAATAAIAQQKVDVQTAWNNYYTFTASNPNKPVPPEMIVALTGAGVSMSTINTQRKAVMEKDDILYNDTFKQNSIAVLAQIQNGMFNPAGSGINLNTMAEMLGAGFLHPDDATSVMAAIKTAENSTPLLHSVETKGFKKQLVDRLKNSFMVQTPSNAALVEALEIEFDMAFIEKVEDHYSVEGAVKPTTEQLRVYLKEAKADIQESQAAVKQKSLENYQFVQAIKDSAQKSKDGRSVFDDDSDIDDVNNVLNNSARGPALLAALLEDPNQLMSWQKKGEDVQEIEAWRILDILSVGGGGFDAWYTENSAHFTRVQ
jgi:hypothetical protein